MDVVWTTPELFRMIAERIGSASLSDLACVSPLMWEVATPLIWESIPWKSNNRKLLLMFTPQVPSEAKRNYTGKVSQLCLRLPLNV